jgi:UDPglucose 6-dehydrogenase
MHAKVLTVLLQVEMCTDAYAAAKGSHALCVLTEWDEFKQLDYEKIYNEMVRHSSASGLRC